MAEEPCVRRLSGGDIDAFLPELARLRIRVFREYPYLYEGSAAYEEKYLKTYANVPESVMVLVWDGGRVVGASSGLPLEVETPEGIRFRLGSGFSVEERRAPPPIGSWVSYRHDGIHPQSGIPRFARFLRLRDDLAGRQPP